MSSISFQTKKTLGMLDGIAEKAKLRLCYYMYIKADAPALSY